MISLDYITMQKDIISENRRMNTCMIFSILDFGYRQKTREIIPRDLYAIMHKLFPFHPLISYLNLYLKINNNLNKIPVINVTQNHIFTFMTKKKDIIFCIEFTCHTALKTIIQAN